MTESILTLLGEAEFSTAGGRVRIPADRRGQLLAYLACHAGWLDRGRLAFLFWPDHDEEAARRNLRKLLFKVRALDDRLDLEADRAAVRWMVATDVKAIDAAAAAGDAARVVALYRGPLLSEFGALEGQLGHWLAGERDRIDQLWREAVLRVADDLAATARSGEASALLAKLIERDEFDEAAVKRLMRVELAGRGAVEALRVYRRFAAALHRELGLEPSLELRRLAAAVEEGRGAEQTASVQQAAADTPAVPAGEATTVYRRPPNSLTPFIGRETELASLVELVSGSGTRLLTLQGPGGVGKSRLAARVLETVVEADTGRWRYSAFVELDSLSDPDAVAGAIAAALGLEPGAIGGTPRDRVAERVGEHGAVLVLDNFEHVLPAAALVRWLLDTCPGLKLIVTSRERLRLRVERLFPLSGLGLPPPGAAVSEAAASSAVALFLDAARRVAPDFELHEGNVHAVMRICRALDGLPLGIELAAAWTRAVGVGSIAEEIEQSLDIVTGATHDAPERHHSLRATFEHSWKQLVPAERDVLRRLSVFRGGFDLKGAKWVAGASLPVLASLVDKSLLRLNAQERYDRHPLVFGFAQEKLEADREEMVTYKDAHLAYFLRVTEELAPQIAGPGQGEALQAIEREHENLITAWNWALDGHKAQSLARLVRVMMLYYDGRGQPSAGVDLFESAVSVLDERDQLERSALAWVLVEQAWLFFRLGRLAESERTSTRGVALARVTDDTAALAKGLFTMGNVAWRQGAYAAASERFVEALALARKQRNSAAVASLLNSIAILEATLGRTDSAKRYYRQALESNRKRGNRGGVIANLNGMAALLLGELKPVQALRYLNEGIAEARIADQRRALPSLMANRANALLQLGDLGAALASCSDALQLAREQGVRGTAARVLTVLGRIATAKGDHTAARDHLNEALRTAWAIHDTPAVLETLTAIGEARTAVGDENLSFRLLALVMSHQATPRGSRVLAENLVRGLGRESELRGSGPRSSRPPGESLDGVVGEALAIA